MPNLREDVLTGKSVRFSIFLRAIYFHALQYETSCMYGNAVTISDLVCPYEA